MVKNGRMAGTGRGKRGAREGRQLGLPFRGHGGVRKGAGRKPNGSKALVDHRPRAALASRFPVHVTCRVARGLPRLRRRRERAVLLQAFAKGCDRFGMRLTHWVVLDDHLHMVCEAKGRDALRRGMQGLLIRIAKALNKLWQRRGKVWADRFHDRVLKTPREVRNVLRYVFGNGHKHSARNGGTGPNVDGPIDCYSSAPWFDGFRPRVRTRGIEGLPRPVSPTRTWLLSTGWRRHGLLSPVGGAPVAPP